MTSLQLIAACWVVFALFWWLQALNTKTTAEQQSMGNRLANMVPLFIGAFLLVQPALIPPLGLHLWPRSDLTSWLGVGICVLGLAGALWARQTLGSNWSSRVTFKEGHELVERGPYRLVRHPIYTSMLLMTVGTVLAIGRLGTLAGFACITAALAVKIVQEESLLMSHFPDSYGAYRARVKALVPYVW